MNAASLIDCGDGVRLERGVRCRMSDGVELASDHYYPPREGRYPCLLMRQPYGRDIASSVVYAHPRWYARQGYNVVVQDVRGRGDSEGEFYPFRHEARDGAETIRWLAERPESNGQVGMYGFSYQGVTQLLAASEQPPGLVCIAPAMSACDLYHGWFYHQGALRLSAALGWGLQLLKADARRLQNDEAVERLEQAWAQVASSPSALPFRDHPALAVAGLPQYVRDWFDHDQPGPYWSALDLSRKLARVGVPALHLSGWYDLYLSGTVAGFRALAEGAASEFARAHQYLIAGPWLHLPWGDRAGEADFGPQALIDTDRILLRWFNHWLKDSGEFSDQPRISHFVLGENRWRSAARFPPPATYVLYVRGEGKANSRKGDGWLGAEPPGRAEPADVFVYDPEVPVPAPGGVAAAGGEYDQSALELGNNLLVFTTPALATELRLLGSPRVSLYCQTSSAHTDFCAKLVRVTPDGRAQFLSIGIARSGWLFRESDYRADQVHLWSFELEPISCRFTAGERIRLEIASSAFPLYDRNPGTATPSARARSVDWRRSTQILYHDPLRASRLELPLHSEAA